MSNHIRGTTIEIRRLSAAEAEVWITAELDTVTPTTELRGRLTGPRCPGVTTLEVAYPLRSLPRQPGGSSQTLTVRAIIPEPSVWTEETPYCYQGPLELWQDGQRGGIVTVSVALKYAR